MRCRRCGTELPPEAQFCLHCGAPVSNAGERAGERDDAGEAPQVIHPAAHLSPDSGNWDGDEGVRDETALMPGSADAPGGSASDDELSDDDEAGFEDDRSDDGDEDASDGGDAVAGRGEDRDDGGTRRVPLDATRLNRGSMDETRLSRRREETAVRGETTLLEGQRTEPEGDPLDAVEDPYADLPISSSRLLDPTAAPVPPPEPERRDGRRSIYLFIAIAAVVVVAVLGAFISWRMELWGGTTVPDVMGLSEAEATARLADAGFEVAVQQVVVDEGAGTVVSMQPQAGRRVETGRTVELGIGVDRTVPDVEGLDVDEARSRLTASGIDHLRLEYQNSSAPKGTVTSVSPAAGTKVAAEEVVTLVVAQPYTVPDVIGLTTEAAEEALQRAGLDADVGYVPSDTVEPGRVISTDPVAGTELDEGSVVALSVSSPYPSSLFDLEGYLSAKPEDVSTYLGEQGYGVGYGRDVDGVAQMTWEANGSGRGMPAIGFTALPFSLPSGFQLFPQDVLRQGAKIEGVYLQLGPGAGRWDAGSIFDLDTGAGHDAPGDAGSASIDSRAAGGEGPIDLDVSQDCITRLMNLCGLRSTSDTTSTATRETIDPALGRDVNLAAKAGVMDDATWYIVVWEPSNPSRSTGGISVAMGMAPSEGLLSRLESHGLDLGDFDDSMANLAATVVLSGGVAD